MRKILLSISRRSTKQKTFWRSGGQLLTLPLYAAAYRQMIGAKMVFIQFLSFFWGGAKDAFEGRAVPPASLVAMSLGPATPATTGGGKA